MDKDFARKLMVVVAILLILPFSVAWALNRSEYEASKARIDEIYGVNRASCANPDQGATRACLARAKAQQKLALAELEHSFSGMESDRIQVLRARAEADYLLYGRPCADESDGAQGLCLRTAHTKLARF